MLPPARLQDSRGPGQDSTLAQFAETMKATFIQSSVYPIVVGLVWRRNGSGQLQSMSIGDQAPQQNMQETCSEHIDAGGEILTLL